MPERPAIYPGGDGAGAAVKGKDTGPVSADDGPESRIYFYGTGEYAGGKTYGDAMRATSYIFEFGNI